MVVLDLEVLTSEMKQIHDSIDALNAKAEAETRDHAPEEVEEIDKLLGRFDELDVQAQRAQKLEKQRQALAKPLPRKTSADVAEARGMESVSAQGKWPAVPALPGGQCGFSSLGEYAIMVRRAAMMPHSIDPRLYRMAAPASAGLEGTGSTGGFLVPPDWRADMIQRIQEETSLLGRCDQLMTGSNGVTLPVDANTPWDTTNGPQVTWVAENTAITPTAPDLKELSIRIHKLTALVPISDELAEDAPACESYLRKKVPEKLSYKVDLAIWAGTGAGQPAGVTTSPAKINVVRGTATTFVFLDLIAMWNRLYAPFRNNAVWVMHQDVEPQLLKMEFVGTSWGTAVYMPQGSVAGTPYSTLLGRPIIYHQVASTLGTTYDVALLDLNQYLAVLKTGTPTTDVSLEFYFDAHATAFRTTLRMGGAPWLPAAISPANGSTTLSAYVFLQVAA